jgi:hypothetical protein
VAGAGVGGQLVEERHGGPPTASPRPRGADRELARHRADLVDEAGQVDVQVHGQRRVERTEEVVEVVRHDQLRREGAQEPVDVAGGEAPPRDPAQEHVDAAMDQRVLDQIARALVIDRDAGDRDVQAPDLAALVGLRGQGVDVLAGQLAAVGHPQAAGQLGVLARDEGHRERAELVGVVRLDHDRALGMIVERHQVGQRARAVDRTAGAGRQRRHVEGVIEVGVADQDRDRIG